MECYIYKFFNKQNELLYIGKTLNITKRISAHLAEKSWKSTEVFYIEYAECENKVDLEVYETYYINKLKPKYNTAKVYNESPSLHLEELNFKKYNKDILKNRENKREKTKNNEYEETEYSYLHENYINTISKNICKIVEINYNKYQELYLQIEGLEEEDFMLLTHSSGKNKTFPLYVISIEFNYKTNKLKITFNKERYLEDNILKQFKEIYELLEIDTLNLDKEYGIKKEKQRLEELSNYFEHLIEDKYKIKLENLVTKEIKTISANRLVKNLLKVVNTGQGYYNLVYNNRINQLIFYDDFKGAVKTYSESGYAFQDVIELNQWLKEKFNDDTFGFKTRKDFYLFWYAICEQRIPCSYSFDGEVRYMEFFIIVNDCVTVEELKQYE